MAGSSRYWQNLWVDALIIEHGPSGYVGPPRIRRDQIWVSQPYHSLVLTGPLDGEVDHAWFTGDGRVYEVDIPSGRPTLYDFHPENRLPVYSALGRMIFPDEFAQYEGRVAVVGSGEVAGRDILRLELSDQNQEHPRFHLWVDTYTGVILWLREYFPGEAVVARDVVVLEITYDTSFGAKTFNRNGLNTKFLEEQRDLPDEQRSSFAIPVSLPAPGHQPWPKLAAPQHFDPAKSALTFQWREPPTSGPLRAYPAGVQSPAGGGREISVDVFAAEYYLGEVRLNPWSVSCARSPDGQIIAYLSQIADQVVRLGWSRLDNLADQKVYRGSVQPRSELTFAPDSRRKPDLEPRWHGNGLDKHHHRIFSSRDRGFFYQRR